MGGKPLAGTRRLRLGRGFESGRSYLVTTVIRNRRPLFSDVGARLVVRALKHQQALGRALTLAFVLMPEHQHWLLPVEGQAKLSRVVQQVKGRSGLDIAREMGLRVLSGNPATSTGH